MLCAWVSKKLVVLLIDFDWIVIGGIIKKKTLDLFILYYVYEYLST